MYSSKLMFVVCSLLAVFLPCVNGHGRLLEPPSRSSMWRFGFDTPHNYNDNELFCGGFQRQWEQNGGKCGVCGDPWDGERQNEAGGKYANGIIVRKYEQGQIIRVDVQITADHKGYIEFRICPHNNPKIPVTQDCLDEHLLRYTDGRTRYNITAGKPKIYKLEVVLPEEVTCSQCVLQWKYNTGNSWGCEDGYCCVGCGKQEQFYGCADVSISQSDEQTTKSANEQTTKQLTEQTTGESSSSRSTSVNDVTTRKTNTETTTIFKNTQPIPTTTKNPDDGGLIPTCQAAGPWTGQESMTTWCIVNCSLGNCPSTHCSRACQLLGPLFKSVKPLL